MFNTFCMYISSVAGVANYEKRKIFSNIFVIYKKYNVSLGTPPLIKFFYALLIIDDIRKIKKKNSRVIL